MRLKAVSSAHMSSLTSLARKKLALELVSEGTDMNVLKTSRSGWSVARSKVGNVEGQLMRSMSAVAVTY